MGKNKKQQKFGSREPERKDQRSGIANENSATGNEGCICPTGCLVGKEIICSDVVGVRAAAASVKKYVKVLCSNSGCKEVPFMHESCYNKWEELLIKQLRMHRITNDWNDEKVKRHLWLTDGGSYCFRGRKCRCGGFLSPVDPEDEELPKPTKKAEKKAAKAAADPERLAARKKQLPALVTRQGTVGRPAHDRAATYCSNYYNDLRNRMRNAPDAEKHSKKLHRPKEIKITAASPVRGVQEGWTRVHTTSFSSSMGESGKRMEWCSMESVPGLYQAKDDWWVNKRQDSDNGITSVESSRMNAVYYESDNEEETDDAGAREAERLVGEIREMLELVGGQLPIDDPLLTGIVEGASGELMLAIFDAGGLEQWLRADPQFDIDKGRIRVGRNVKCAPARLQTSGLVEVKMETHGVINCPAYDCKVYFEVGIPETHTLRKGDVVKFEAIECKMLVNGHRWMATRVTLLQRESQPLLTAVRRSCQDKGPVRTLQGVSEQSVPVEQATRQPVIYPTPVKQCPESYDSTSFGDVVENYALHDTERHSVALELGTVEGTDGKQDEALADMVRQLTKEFVPVGDPPEESVYASTLEMLKSWEMGAGGNGDV